ncbi:MAG: hypothetical protein MHM6MM_002511 [Cercozoa sp. M6MM]
MLRSFEVTDDDAAVPASDDEEAISAADPFEIDIGVPDRPTLTLSRSKVKARVRLSTVVVTFLPAGFLYIVAYATKYWLINIMAACVSLLVMLYFRTVIIRTRRASVYAEKAGVRATYGGLFGYTLNLIVGMVGAYFLCAHRQQNIMIRRVIPSVRSVLPSSVYPGPYIAQMPSDVMVDSKVAARAWFSDVGVCVAPLFRQQDDRSELFSNFFVVYDRDNDIDHLCTDPLDTAEWLFDLYQIHQQEREATGDTEYLAYEGKYPTLATALDPRRPRDVQDARKVVFTALIMLSVVVSLLAGIMVYEGRRALSLLTDCVHTHIVIRHLPVDWRVDVFTLLFRLKRRVLYNKWREVFYRFDMRNPFGTDAICYDPVERRRAPTDCQR